MVKGQSAYYKVIRRDGKQAIFHKNDKDNPVSNWYDIIFMKGLVMGESEYYEVSDSKRRGSVYYVSDKNNPINDNLKRRI